MGPEAQMARAPVTRGGAEWASFDGPLPPQPEADLDCLCFLRRLEDAQLVLYTRPEVLAENR